VAQGTRAMTDEDRREFAIRFREIKEFLAAETDAVWNSKFAE
jgi:hypothetical protein